MRTARILRGADRVRRGDHSRSGPPTCARKGAPCPPSPSSSRSTTSSTWWRRRWRGSRSWSRARTSSASRWSSWTTRPGTGRPARSPPSRPSAGSRSPRLRPPRRGTGPAPVPAVELGRGRHGKTDWIFLRHERNGGKGTAVRTALALADGEYSVIHDADLEYHPKDILRIVEVFVREKADAVFGSRFAGGEARRVLLFRHQIGNKLLTFLTNLATNLNLTDMETCYKAVRTDLLRSIPIVSNDFRLEPELTIKLAKREARIFEVPISYSGRTYQEGKKIGWRDGFQALARHPPLLARRRRLRPRRARLADARAAGPGRAVQRLDGRRDPPVPGVPAAGDRLGNREPDPAARPPRRLRGERREPALREDAREPHHRPALPGGALHRRHRPRLLSRSWRAASTRWSA